MKTAVSIPDEVFADADRLAKRLSKSRSQLYAEALAEYIARRQADSVTAQLDEVLEELPSGERRYTNSRAFLRRAARSVVREEEGEW
ncbi:MAG: hypothetical protein P1V51_12530 [Deltaproteobacteria bacterium]|nr:hypothetical protein [Deltaproteobacteria bacterium]